MCLSVFNTQLLLGASTLNVYLSGNLHGHLTAILLFTVMVDEESGEDEPFCFQTNLCFTMVTLV